MRNILIKRNKIIVFLAFILISTISFTNFSHAEKNIDLFNDILSTVKGSTVECGIKVSFEIEEDGKKYCMDLLNKLNINTSNIKITKGENSYSLEFNKNEEKGYIECISYDNHNVVTLNILSYCNENNLSFLKAEVQKAIMKSDKDMDYFLYLKAKVAEDNISEINYKVEALLKQNNAKNINSVKLENGLSTVAYTKQFKPMKNDGELMDLNYAVCSYSSGNYIIIGTPIIIEAY